MTACGTVIGTAGLVRYNPCLSGEGGDGQRWMMVIVSGVVVAAAAFFTLRRRLPTALRLVVASLLGLAVVAGLMVLAPGTWIGGCPS